MESIKPMIVEVIKASNWSRWPLKKDEIINFANSLIEGGGWQMGSPNSNENSSVLMPRMIMMVTPSFSK
jgi:hypothetical protein